MAKISGGYNIEADLKDRFRKYCLSHRLGPVEDIVGAAMLWFLDADADEQKRMVSHYTEALEGSLAPSGNGGLSGKPQPLRSEPESETGT